MILFPTVTTNFVKKKKLLLVLFKVYNLEINNLKALFVCAIYLNATLAKAQQLLLDQNERDYILSQVNSAKG